MLVGHGFDRNELLAMPQPELLEWFEIHKAHQKALADAKRKAVDDANRKHGNKRT